MRPEDVTSPMRRPTRQRMHEKQACGNCGGDGYHPDANGDTVVCRVCHGTTIVLSGRWLQIYNQLANGREYHD